MEPKFLYIGSTKEREFCFVPGSTRQHPILSFTHTCAYNKIAIAAIMSLNLDPNKYFLEESQGSLIFNMEKEIELPPTFVYMIPFHHEFQKIEPEYKHIWISRINNYAVDKINIDNVLQFVKNSHILIKINS